MTQIFKTFVITDLIHNNFMIFIYISDLVYYHKHFTEIHHSLYFNASCIYSRNIQQKGNVYMQVKSIRKVCDGLHLLDISLKSNSLSHFQLLFKFLVIMVFNLTSCNDFGINSAKWKFVLEWYNHKWSKVWIFYTS